MPKKIISITLALSMIICFSTCVYAISANDSPSLWATEGVSEAIQIGFVPDVLQSRYQDNITRGEFARLAICFLGIQYGYTENLIYSQFYEDFFTYYTNSIGDHFNKEDFTDSSRGSRYGWAYILNDLIKVFNDYPNLGDENANINAAYLLGIVNGTGNDTFDPSGEITRQEAAVMLARTYSVIVPDYEPDYAVLSYSDNSNISDWAQNGVAFTCKFNIFVGDENGNFNPQEYLTREQGILAFLRAYNNTPGSRAQGTIHSLKSTEEIIATLTSPIVYSGMPYRYDTDICTIVYITYGGYLGEYPQNCLYLIYPTGVTLTASIPDVPLMEFRLNSAETYLTFSTKNGTDKVDYCIDLRTGQVVSSTLPQQN